MSLTLTNNYTLYSYNNNKKTIIPANSKLEYVETETSLFAYYEMFIYVVICNLIEENNNKIPVNIRCTKYIGANRTKVNCVENNQNNKKEFYWSEVFDKDFPT